jgi:23S rRNA pseudouridine2605 synthase
VQAERGGCTIVLNDGRKRQVRRMLAAVGHDVIRLQRIRIGSLRLGNLPEGQYRKLSDAELMALLEPEA